MAMAATDGPERTRAMTWRWHWRRSSAMAEGVTAYACQVVADLPALAELPRRLLPGVKRVRV